MIIMAGASRLSCVVSLGESKFTQDCKKNADLDQHAWHSDVASRTLLAWTQGRQQVLDTASMVGCTWYHHGFDADKL